jgi:hypothetical protein
MPLRHGVTYAIRNDLTDTVLDLDTMGTRPGMSTFKLSKISTGL